MKFILNNDKEIVETDLITWATWFEDVENRTVAHWEVGQVSVSTVFLGITDSGLFETMIFGGERDNEGYRTNTYEEAQQKHDEVVKSLRRK